MIISYPRPPIAAVWPQASPGQTARDGIDLKTWLSDNAPGDTIASATAVAAPNDLQLSAVTITDGTKLTLTHTGASDGTTYIVMFAVNTVGGLSNLFPVATTVTLPGSVLIPPTSEAALVLLLKSLPTTPPSQPGVLWLDGGVPALS